MLGGEGGGLTDAEDHSSGSTGTPAVECPRGTSVHGTVATGSGRSVN